MAFSFVMSELSVTVSGVPGATSFSCVVLVLVSKVANGVTINHAVGRGRGHCFSCDVRKVS